MSFNLNEITFKKLYSQVVYNLKKAYNRANSSFTLASPYGHILSILTEMFQLNMLYVQNVRRQFDMNDPLNSDTKTVRSLAKIGQYNPARGSCASGVIKLRIKAGVDINQDIKGGKIVFTNRAKLKNDKNNLEYVLHLNQDTLTFTLNNQTPILLNIIQGRWETQTFTGTGEKNQSFVAVVPNQREIDNYKFNLYVDSELWVPKKHKFDMLPNEKAYVPYTSFTNGVDIVFGNGDEGMVPPIGSIIEFEYLLTDGKEGNVIDPLLNEFKFTDLPKDYYGNDVDTDQFFDIDVETNITFGTDAETPEWLKSILPYASSNFVLAGPDQYKFLLKRMGLFSIIDVYSERKSDKDTISKIYQLAQSNTTLLYKLNNDDSNSTLRQLVSQNLSEITKLRKLMLTEGGDNLINIFLIPDVRIFYGSDKDTNYFNIDLSAFTLDTDEKNRILNFLSQEGVQTILNEIKIIDPVIKRYAVNVTLRLFDDAVDDNINNEIINSVSEYFIELNRRDRIPPSDLVRIIDGIDGVDSVDVTYISELNEKYHMEFLIKAEQWKRTNGAYPTEEDIIMSDGTRYDSNKTIGLDPILGDILIDKTDLPIVRGGFIDRYNNSYNVIPGSGPYSAVNILILPQRSKRKGLI